MTMPRRVGVPQVLFCWRRPDGVTDGDAEMLVSSKLFPPHKGWAVFPFLSLINHDCSPNSQVIFTEDNTALVITSRELASSEEVSISYVPTSLPVVERRAQLRARYGFDCHCATCTSELGRGRSKAQMSEARATGTKREGPHHEGHTGRVKGCGA